VNPLAQSGGKMLYQNRIEELAKKILAEEAVVYMHIIDGFFETVERLNKKLLSYGTEIEKAKALYEGEDLIQEINQIEFNIAAYINALITKMNILNRVSKILGMGEIFPFNPDKDLKKQALYFFSCLMQEAQEVKI